MMGLVEDMMTKLKIRLVMKLLKEFNYKLGVKLILGMVEAGDDIGPGVFMLFSKCITY